MTAVHARRLPLGALVALWIAAAAAGAAPAAETAAAAETDSSGPSVLVQTTRLQRGSLPLTVTAYGSVQTDPGGRDSIVAPVAAVVAQIYVRSGEAVTAGAPLLLLQPSPPTAAAYTQAVSALQLASQAVMRTRQLLDQLLATQQQLAEAEKAESDARATLAALRAQGAGGPTTLRAPNAAIVTMVSATVSALVTEGTALLELARPNGLVLAVGIAPEEAAAVAMNEPVSVTPIGAASARTTKVLSRGSIVEADSGLVPVRIALPPGVFLPGETVRAVITIGMVQGYVVPHQAVLIDDNGDPYVVQAVDGMAKVVRVRVLGTQGEQDTISGSLDSQAPLVVSGNYQAQDGMKLRLADPPEPASR